jgi:hypothetical protein
VAAVHAQPGGGVLGGGLTDGCEQMFHQCALVAARCSPRLVMRACLSDHLTMCDSDGSSESLHMHLRPVQR